MRFLGALSVAHASGQLFAADLPSQSFTYQGKFFNASGSAPLLSVVDLTLEIYSPGSDGTAANDCLLYAEKQTGIDLSLTGGLFSVQVGSIPGAPKRAAAGNDPGLTMAQIFSNKAVSLRAPGADCLPGYTPASGDARKLRVTVIDGGMPTTLTPDQVINAVPQATNAETLQGVDLANIIQATGNVSQSTLATLVGAGDASTLHHHDSSYLKSGSASNQNLGSATTYTSGKLGVGTSAPSASFEVIGPTGAAFRLADGNQGVGKVLISDATGNATWQSVSSMAGATGASGSSGATGASGADGSSGATGASGAQGMSGATGASGNDGAVGNTGASGFTGATGANGAQGNSGATGATGADGAQGNSGSSGASGATGANGAQGNSGASGATGANGAQGNSGATGATGADGSQGAVGNTGASGATGANGAQGNSGASGATGANGVQGNSGATGATGADGSQGAVGNTGASGAQGNSGASGATGANGAQGNSGASGATGANGAQGNSGASGATGASGAQGTSGATGATGADGSQGAVGMTGASGATGANGAQGNSGASGATGANGAQGTSGATGATGADGSQGAVGMTGASGATGANGAQGNSGATGANGAQGNSGATGATGADGSQGAVGMTGASGASGATGANGAQGNSGATGATGADGSQGAVGNTGASGATGANGAQGTSGATGATGADGSQGAVGMTGASGATGANGAQGNSGASGATGANGAQGNSGASGATGANGAQGNSGATGATGASGAVGASGTTGATGASPWILSGSDVQYTAGNVGIGAAASANSALNIERTTTSGGGYGSNIYHFSNPSADTSSWFYGSRSNADVGGNVNYSGWFIGTAGEATNWGLSSPKTLNSMAGLYGYAINDGSANVSNLYGTWSQAQNNRFTGTATNQYGVYGQAVNYGGAVSSAYGVAGNVTMQDAGVTMSNAYGLHTSVTRVSGNITNAYGLYVGGVVGTNKWSLYASDTAAPSYFGGNVGIGTTAPGSLLEIAGSASASNNPWTSRGAKLSTSFNSNGWGGYTAYGLDLTPSFNNAGAAGQTYVGLNLAPTASGNGGGNLYGLYVNPSNSGNNTVYSAAFMGGGVGIGTSAPAATLHVVGPTGAAFRLADGSQGAGKYLTSDASGNATWATISGSAGATGASGVTGATGVAGAIGASGASGASGATGATGAQGGSGATGASGSDGATGATGAAGAAGSNGASGASGATGATGASPFTLSGSDVYYTAGNVGIGTISPTSPLEVAQVAGAMVNAVKISGDSTGGWAALNVQQNGNGGRGLLVNMANSSATDYIADFRTANVSKMFVGSNGLVGIGTTAPTSALDIYGTSNGLRLSYDASNSMVMSTNSSGVTIFDGVGSSPGFLFGDRGGFGGTYSNVMLATVGATSSTTAGYMYGSTVEMTDTGVVSSGTDTTMGQYIVTNRSGATGGTINTYGQQIVVTTDNSGAGTSNAYGTFIDTGTAAATNADNVYGMYISTEANASTTAYGIYVNAGAGAGTEYAGAFMNGNVGIGTSAPTARLEISESADVSALQITTPNLNAASAFNITAPLSTDANTGKAFSFKGTGDGWARGMFYTDGKYGIGDGTATRDVFISRRTAGVLKVSSDGAAGSANLEVLGSLGVGTTGPATALDVNGAFSQRGMSAPAVSSAGAGRVYFDSTSNKFRVSQNGAAYVDLVGGSGTPAGNNTELQFNSSGAFGSSSNLAYDGTTFRVGPSAVPYLTVDSSNTTVLQKLQMNTDGTAAAPAIHWGLSAADSNTGIFHPAADTLALSTAGSERVRVSNLGYVGIGTTNPGQMLSVLGGNVYHETGTAGATPDRFVGPGAGQSISHDSSYGTILNSWTSVLVNLDSDNGDADTRAFYIAKNSDRYTGGSPNGTTLFKVEEGGNVGIGTTSPGQKLTVAGTIESTSGGVKFPDGSTQTSAAPNVDYQVFTADGTWSKPTGFSANAMVTIHVWGGGGGGGSFATGGGGGGGACQILQMPLSALGATETITVGSGGAVNTAGGSSSFGSIVTVYGGGPGSSSTVVGGGGGGIYSVGVNGAGGSPLGGTTGSPVGTDSIYGGSGSGTASANHGGKSVYGGAAGGNGGGSGFGGSGGSSFCGGGGGAGYGSTAYGNPGTSSLGGAGGAAGAAGNVPAGGGSRNAAGARGEVRVWVTQ